MRITYDAQTPDLTRPPAKRLRTKTSGLGMYRPGLNIQWPFSQLVLLGVKTEEIRSYALNHRDIAVANQEYYIVETKGPSKKAMKNAIFGDIDIAPRPNAAHLVGTVTFSQSHQYKDQNTFHQARDKHCVAEGAEKYDWDGTGNRQSFGWQVSKVKAFTTPIPAVSTGTTGFGSRYYPATFA